MKTPSVVLAIVTTVGTYGYGNTSYAQILPNNDQNYWRIVFDTAPTLFYMPHTHQLLPLIANRQSGAAPPANGNVTGAAQSYRDSNTGFPPLPGLGFPTYHNWIFDSQPQGASIVGLQYNAPLHTAQKIMNLPDEEVQKLRASKGGYRTCYYGNSVRSYIEDEGMKWIYLLCRLGRR